MSKRSRRTFQQLVTLPDGAIPLVEAALLMASEEYPQLEIGPYLDRLDEIAGAARLQVEGTATPVEKVIAINDVLFNRYGFRGNTDDYYDPRNSFLNDVIDRHLGIPITLSAIYIEISRRLDFAIQGVGLPGHFIVKYSDRNEEFFIDPFKAGALLTISDCRQFIRDNFGPSFEFSQRMVARVTNRQILWRMLNNLKKIYVDSKSFDKGLTIVDMMLMVEPDDIDQYRDRGLIRIQLRQFEGAVKDLEHYVKNTQESRERGTAEDQLRELRRIHAMMN